MRRNVLVIAFLVAALALILQAQTTMTPKPPFTAKDAEMGKKLAATSLAVRRQITDMRAPAQPFKIAGNLYFVGIANGEVYLLTSPQGHILFGTGYDETVPQVQKNIESLGFKMTDIKAIVVNHNHPDQASGSAAMKRITGAPLMAGFGEIPYLEHGGILPPRTATPNVAPRGRGGRDPAAPRYPPVKVDRALFDGDVVKVGPLSFTAYLIPGHSPSSTSFLYTVRDGGRDYRVVEFCCWEYPDDLSQRAEISEAGVRHTLATFRKMLPVDIYLETGAYAWSGVLNQPSGTILERIAKARENPKLFINREIFTALSAAREVEFEEKLQTLRAGNPAYR